MYVRMTFSSIEVYEVLEPMLNDYRKLRWRDASESPFSSCLAVSDAHHTDTHAPAQTAAIASPTWMCSSTIFSPKSA